jgi:hypothetical protein
LAESASQVSIACRHVSDMVGRDELIELSHPARGLAERPQWVESSHYLVTQKLAFGRSDFGP